MPLDHATTITDARAAAAFGSGRARRILFALMAGECSLSELAATSQTPLNLLHHHIRKLIGLGLVRIAGERRRAGAPIKLYRASARAFFVPAELAGPPTKDVDTRLRDQLEQSFARSCRGVLYSLDGTNVRMELVRDPDFTAHAFEFWSEVALSEADASALANELRLLLRRYADRPSGRRRYLVHAALAPAR
jgi:hypothetical protein